MTAANVVHIITKLELGGAQQNTLFTVEHLDRERFRPFLITGEDGYLVPQALALDGVKTFLVPEMVREINPPKDLAVIYKLSRVLKGMKGRDEQPLIVHTHSSKAGIVGRWAARLAGADIIVHSIHGFGFHDGQHPLTRYFFIGLEKATARVTDAFVGVSQANIDRGVRLRIFPRRKAVLIRSGIELDKYKGIRSDAEKKKQRLGVNTDLPLVTMVGCLKPQKAPLDFVEVARRVVDRKAAQFALVGDGELRGRVEKKIGSAALGEQFKLLGWRTDVPDILAATDIFVLTSLWEGLPRVVPEALAAGIPVVATRVDGTPEAVIDGENGYLAAPGDVATIAEKIIYLLEHPDTATDMGRRGSLTVDDFDIHSMVTKQEALYTTLLESKNGRIT